MISLHSKNTGILYESGKVVMIGSNSYKQCEMSDNDNKNVIDITVGSCNVGLLLDN